MSGKIVRLFKLDQGITVYCIVTLILVLFTVSITNTGTVSSSTETSNDPVTLLVPPVYVEPEWPDISVYRDSKTMMPALVPTPTNNEQWMLELVNEARRDPGAFGYPGETPAPPLYFESGLNQAAMDHTSNMLFGSPYAFFDHDSYENCTARGICWSGSSGCHPPPPPYSCTDGNCAAAVCDFVELFADRVSVLYPSYTRIGENIACYSSVPIMHQGWMDSSGHRRNIMNGAFREIGISFITGGPCGAMGTEDFGNRSGINPPGSGSVFTGVVYEDLNSNGKYEAGEGIDGALVDAGTVSETTWPTGGFNLLPPAVGLYTITVTAPGYMPNTETDVEAVANLTTKIDFIMIPGTAPTYTPSPTPTSTPTLHSIPANSGSGLVTLCLMLVPVIILLLKNSFSKLL